MPDIIVVGSFVQDLAFRTPVFPTVGETRIGTFMQGQGGKGFNQAIASARVGAATLFVGATGNDVFADSAFAFANAEGLATQFEKIEGSASGAAAILVNETGDNQIVVALGANGELSPEWIDGCEVSFRDTKVVLCQLEANLAAMGRALELGKNSGAITVLNLAPINEGFDVEMLRLAEVVTPNETEFGFVYERKTGKQLSERYFETDDAQLHALCRELEVPVVVITLGEEGSFLSVAEEALPGGMFLKCGSFRRFRPISAKPVDTAGAGDAFNGGFVAGLVKFAGDLERAIAFASVVAGLSVEKPGTAPSMPTLAEVRVRSGGLDLV